MVIKELTKEEVAGRKGVEGTVQASGSRRPAGRVHLGPRGLPCASAGRRGSGTGPGDSFSLCDLLGGAL